MLEERARTYVSVTRFPDGDVKVSGSHWPGPSRQQKTRERRSEIERQAEAAKRAATAVRDLCKYFQLGYLMTLTYRGPVFDRRRVQRDFKKFLRLTRLKLPDFFCIAVLEFHRGGGANDGGIHLHLALDRFQPVQVLRAAWWAVVGDRLGNVQVEHRIYRDSAKRVGAYVAKYVSSDFDSLPREKGQHRYLRSRVCRIPREKLVYFSGQFREHLAAARALLIFNSNGSYFSEWQSEDGWQFVFKSYG
jgi:hypothetical protein